MVYIEALQKGFEPCGSAKDRHYVAHKSSVAERTVCWAGGTRKGLAYVLMPDLKSGNHCFRQYLKPPMNWKHKN